MRLRNSLITVLACCALFAVLTLIPTTSESQPAVPQINEDSKLVWDHDNKDINGGVTLIGRFEVAISFTNQDLSTGGTAFKTISVIYPCPECPVNPTTLGTTCKWTVAELITGRANGGYRLWVRAADSTGVLGPWSLPLLVERISKPTPKPPPKPPTGLRCE